jgi:hypothetical protein
MLCDNCKQPIDIRTIRQNSALHLWFKQVADTLNESGMDMRVFISQEIDIPWTPQTVKDHIWRPTQKLMTGKPSTTRLKKREIDLIYDVINKAIGERTGQHVPFPSIDSLMNKDICQ